MFPLLANGAPSPFPTADTPARELAVWGACVSVALLLGGWGVLNRNRPDRYARVGVALLVAMILVAFAALFAMSRDWERQQARNERERQEQIQRLEERERESQR
ncbi:hypothetical protein R5W23_002420 [Gemmata sp. JC673]|uniref:Uncharacterized protein n=1 Tax=Gemmata algarum TaxID=2975278 RepID=A0ABU5F0Y3_9BACT|nr:hypothetical protein [Gemmata algarum]MDY3561159.1 hypothetical protein [Gemmata algarum]